MLRLAMPHKRPDFCRHAVPLRIGQFVMNRTGAILAGGGEYEPLPKRPKVKSRCSPEALALSKLHRREKDWRAKELVFRCN